MADAKRESEFKTVKKMVEVEEVQEVREFHLTLSEEEAATLRQVLYRIGGHPHETARGITDRIELALRGAGAQRADHPLKGDIPNFIYFDKNRD